VTALKVVRGDATPEEVAALVAVLAARSGGGSVPPEERSLWARPQVRRALPAPGPGAWRAAARDARTSAGW
jgi:hypothetical protein